MPSFGKKIPVQQVLQNMNNKLKIVISGDGAVGKTCVLMGYALKVFPAEYVPTVFDNYHLQVKIEDRPVAVEIVDTAGQEEFRQIRQLGYQGADVLILCYSVSNPASFENLGTNWIPEIRQSKANEETPLVIAGTKADLRNQSADYTGPFVSLSEAKKLAKKYKAAGPLECSALANYKLGDLFNLAIKKAISDRQKVGGCSLF
eukprot:maker-scaffold_1-snap-gene-9.19-mRNA-1 protein AED:0.27 eAED:0.27 QI:126/1/1/1/0.75/0.6/5/281/202